MWARASGALGRFCKTCAHARAPRERLATTGATLLRPERNLGPWARASRALEETCETRTHIHCAPSSKTRSSLGATAATRLSQIIVAMGAATPRPNKNYRRPYGATIKTPTRRHDNLALGKQCGAGEARANEGATTTRPDGTPLANLAHGIMTHGQRRTHSAP